MRDDTDDEYSDASVDGAPTDEGTFFNPHGNDNWAAHLRRNPTQPDEPKWPPNQQGKDELQWGNSTVQVLPVPVLGTFTTPVVQLVQLTRTARLWNVSLQWSVSQGNPAPVTEFVRAVFVITLGLGSSSTRIFRELDKAALQTFLGNPPTANVIVEGLPAKQVLVTGIVEWRTVVGAGTTIHELSAGVAPVVR